MGYTAVWFTQLVQFYTMAWELFISYIFVLIIFYTCTQNVIFVEEHTHFLQLDRVTLKVKQACSSIPLVLTYQTIRRHDPDYHNINKSLHHRENLNYHTEFCYFSFQIGQWKIKYCDPNGSEQTLFLIKNKIMICNVVSELMLRQSNHQFRNSWNWNDQSRKSG